MSVVRVDPSGGSDRTSTMIEHRRSVTLLALLPFLLSGNYFFFPLFFLSLSLFLRLGRIDHLHQYSSTSCPRDETLHFSTNGCPAMRLEKRIDRSPGCIPTGVSIRSFLRVTTSILYNFNSFHLLSPYGWVEPTYDIMAEPVYRAELDEKLIS